MLKGDDVCRLRARIEWPTKDARQVKDEIILEGSFEGRRIRWIFSQITATSFHWRNMESSDDGTTWTTAQEMAARRAY